MGKTEHEEVVTRIVTVKVDWIPDAEKKKAGVILKDPLLLHIPTYVEGIDLKNFISGWLNLKYSGLYNDFKIID